MDEYKLTYFDVKGYGEPMRFLFALAKVPFVDERIPYDSGFPKLSEDIKKNCPWGQVPILEYNGVVIAQSSAITRFLARKFGFCGKDEIEAAKCDEFVDAGKDFIDQWRGTFISEGEDKTKKIEKFLTEATPEFLGRLDRHLGEKKTFLVGSSVTWADLYIVHMISMLEEYMEKSLVHPFDNVKRLVNTVYEIPEIVKFQEDTAHLNQSWIKFKQTQSK